MKYIEAALSTRKFYSAYCASERQDEIISSFEYMSDYWSSLMKGKPSVKEALSESLWLLSQRELNVQERLALSIEFIDMIKDHIKDPRTLAALETARVYAEAKASDKVIRLSIESLNPLGDALSHIRGYLESLANVKTAFAKEKVEGNSSSIEEEQIEKAFKEAMDISNKVYLLYSNTERYTMEKKDAYYASLNDALKEAKDAFEDANEALDEEIYGLEEAKAVSKLIATSVVAKLASENNTSIMTIASDVSTLIGKSAYIAAYESAMEKNPEDYAAAEEAAEKAEDATFASTVLAQLEILRQYQNPFWGSELKKVKK